MAGTLLGLENPSGRLPMIIYESEQQLPNILDYNIWKGCTYQYLSSKPLYRFRHGLSYSNFEYADLQRNDVVYANGTLQCSIKVKNTSDIVGEGIIRVCVSREKTSVCTFPLKKLIAFTRVNSKPNRSKMVTFTITPRQLSVWQDGEWKMFSGKYSLFVGGGQKESSRGMNKDFEIK